MCIQGILANSHTAMPAPLPLTSSNNELTQLRIFKKLESLEQKYKDILSLTDRNFEQTFLTYFELTKAYRTWTAYIATLKAERPDAATQAADHLFEEYLKSARSIHEKNTFWITLYLGLIWPEEYHSKKVRRRIKDRIKKQWQAQSKQNLETLKSITGVPRESRLKQITDLNAKILSLDPNGLAWLNTYRQLIDTVYDELIYTINDNRRQIDHCFKKTVYGSAVTTDDPVQRASINDWIDGYKITGQDEISVQLRTEQKFKGPLKASQHRQLFRSIVKKAVLASVTVIFLVCANAFGIDKVVYTFVKDKTLQLLSLDPASLSLKQKKQFFYNFIIDVNEKLTPDDLARSLREFNEQRLQEQDSGAYMFSDTVLQKYLLLLTSKEIPAGLKNDVIESAGLINVNVKGTLKKITDMFTDGIVEDSKLRELLLELRRSFVRHNVFPFTFIVVKNDTPYIFLFTEKIIKKYRFRAQDLNFLGFNPTYYAQFVRFPLRVYVVQGTTYPFKDRAGYFEGEFAVVFAEMAARTEWSAWHEFAHIIDNMRYMYGGKSLPKNIEINAVLFPAIFAEDSKNYLLNRVFYMARASEPNDAYVQAAKGILNGITLVNSEGQTAPPRLITDEFLPQDIQAAEKLILSKEPRIIRATALKIYKNPDKYLYTAKAGQYHGIISNAEEVIAGTPGTPFQGFILGGDNSGNGPNNSKIKFLFDNVDDDQGFFQGKNLWQIMKELFYFMTHAPSSSIKGFHLMNIIASVVDFILIVGFFIGIHKMSSPLRKRKFYGFKMSDLVQNVYKNHSLSDGRSAGRQSGEQQLLIEALASQGNITEDLRSRIRALKAILPERQRELFDTLLTLAPFNPEKSKVISKWHDFMFWLPYFGPTIGRNPWFFPRQKSFRQWELFTERLTALAKSLNRTTHPDAFRRAYMSILKDFKNTTASVGTDTADKTILHLKETEASIQDHLHEWARTADLKTPIRARRLPWMNQSDGDFDHLAPYTWNDDVKRIDWKATARSPNLEPKVKKYSGSMTAQIDFLFDFRSIAHAQAREKIAHDLVRSLQILRYEHELKAITLIMPSGEIRQKVLNMKSNYSRADLIRRIWSAVNHEFDEDRQEHRALAADDLIFYTPQENRMYRQISRLTDFNITDGQVKDVTDIPAKSYNVYFIGIDETDREDLTRLLPRTHQPFYWK